MQLSEAAKVLLNKLKRAGFQPVCSNSNERGTIICFIHKRFNTKRYRARSVNDMLFYCGTHFAEFEGEAPTLYTHVKNKDYKSGAEYAQEPPTARQVRADFYRQAIQQRTCLKYGNKYNTPAKIRKKQGQGLKCNQEIRRIYKRKFEFIHKKSNFFMPPSFFYRIRLKASRYAARYGFFNSEILKLEKQKNAHSIAFDFFRKVRKKQNELFKAAGLVRRICDRWRKQGASDIKIVELIASLRIYF